MHGSAFGLGPNFRISYATSNAAAGGGLPPHPALLRGAAVTSTRAPRPGRPFASRPSAQRASRLVRNGGGVCPSPSAPMSRRPRTAFARPGRTHFSQVGGFALRCRSCGICLPSTSPRRPARLPDARSACPVRPVRHPTRSRDRPWLQPAACAIVRGVFALGAIDSRALAALARNRARPLAARRVGGARASVLGRRLGGSASLCSRSGRSASARRERWPAASSRRFGPADGCSVATGSCAPRVRQPGRRQRPHSRLARERLDLLPSSDERQSIARPTRRTERA